MAFTAAQINSISKITQITPTLLNAHIVSLGDTLTGQIETDVLAEVTRWTTGGIGTGFFEVFPNDRNFGARIKTTDAQADVISNIRTLLEIPDYLGPMKHGYGTIQLGL